MKKFNAKAVFFIIILIILAGAVTFLVINSKKTSNNISTTAVSGTESLAATPIVTADPSTYEGVDVPEGIYIVDAPASANDTYIGSSDSSSSGSNSGIYIVDPPADANTSSNSGIYIVDPPKETSSGSGIYIVNTPNPGSGGGGTGSYGSVIKSGSFSSNTGTGLNMTVSYTVTTVSSTSVQIIMTANLSHAQLSSKASNISFSCAGQNRSTPTASINGSGPSYLGSQTFTVDIPQGQSSNVSMSASWGFNGSYSGTYIGTVNASASVGISR